MTDYRTFCCYGDTRSGKSRFAGTFPNAVFISDASERGWTTLETMPQEDFYCPGQGPVILPVSDQADMIYALSVAERWVRQGFIDSVVVDSITFYAWSWFQTELQKQIAAAGAKGSDTRALYGALANHLSNTRQQIHKWPCHVVWTALAAPPEDQQPGGPMLPGQSRRSFPAGCDHILYHNKWMAKEEDGTEVEVYEVRTRAFGRYIGGGRDGGILPDPLSWPTFRLFAGHLNLREFPPKIVPDAELIAAVQQMPSTHAAPAANKTIAPAKAPAAKPPVRTK